MDLVGALQRSSVWKLYFVKRFTSIYLNLGFIINYSVVQKFLLSFQYASLYDALYKPSGMVGLVKTDLAVC